MKHNKKRNTAFLYESLVKELTTFQGKSGFGGLDSLARGITEGKETEEDKLFKTSKQVDNLIKNLLKKVKTDETNS